VVALLVMGARAYTLRILILIFKKKILSSLTYGMSSFIALEGEEKQKELFKVK
jgi:hypothetical protein